LRWPATNSGFVGEAIAMITAAKLVRGHYLF